MASFEHDENWLIFRFKFEARSYTLTIKICRILQEIFKDDTWLHSGMTKVDRYFVLDSMR